MPAMESAAEVTCPYCFEGVELWIDPDTLGELVEDCPVCCRPWSVTVTRDEKGRPRALVERAQ